MASYESAFQYGLTLSKDTGKRVRVYGVAVAQCVCAKVTEPHPDFKGYEWYAYSLPTVPPQMPNLSIS